MEHWRSSRDCCLGRLRPCTEGNILIKWWTNWLLIDKILFCHTVKHLLAAFCERYYLLLLATLNQYLCAISAFTEVICAGLFQSKAKHHAVSAKLDKTFNFTADSFVVQWVASHYLDFAASVQYNSKVSCICSFKDDVMKKSYIECLTCKAVHLQSPHYRHHHKTFAHKIGTFSHLHLPVLFKMRACSVTHPEPFGILFLLLMHHSLPSPLFKNCSQNPLFPMFLFLRYGTASTSLLQS